MSSLASEKSVERRVPSVSAEFEEAETIIVRVSSVCVVRSTYRAPSMIGVLTYDGVVVAQVQSFEFGVFVEFVGGFFDLAVECGFRVGGVPVVRGIGCRQFHPYTVEFDAHAENSPPRWLIMSVRFHNIDAGRNDKSHTTCTRSDTSRAYKSPPTKLLPRKIKVFELVTWTAGLL